MNKLLFVAAMFMAIASTSVSGSASAASAPKTNSSETNQTSYWGSSCTKTEMSGEVMTYTSTNDAVTKVIVKGGPAYVVYNNGDFTNLTAPINPKNNKPYGISHVIECSTPTTPITPQDPITPTTPTVPTTPVTPTNPVVPTVPTTPATPSTPATPDEPAVLSDTTEAAKGSSTTTPVPTELPNTGPSSISMLPILLIGSVITLIAYRLKLASIKSRLYQ